MYFSRLLVICLTLTYSALSLGGTSLPIPDSNGNPECRNDAATNSAIYTVKPCGSLAYSNDADGGGAHQKAWQNCQEKTWEFIVTCGEAGGTLESNPDASTPAATPPRGNMENLGVGCAKGKNLIGSGWWAYCCMQLTCKIPGVKCNPPPTRSTTPSKSTQQ